MQKNFRIIISLLLLSIVTFIIFNVHELNEAVVDNQYNELINELNKVSMEFNTWISNKKEILNTSKDIVNNFSYDEIVDGNVLNPLLNINNDDPNISQIYIGLDTGAFITGGEWVPPSNYDPRTRPWYIEAVEADDTIISRVYIDMETTEQMVTISSPLYLDDVFIGVISADVFLKNISTYLQDQLPNEATYSYIIDANGMIVVHTRNPKFIGINIYSNEQQHVISDYADLAKNSDELIKMAYELGDQNIRGIMQKVGSVDWYLTIAAEESRPAFILNTIKETHLLFNSIALTIILLMLFLVTKIKQSLVKKNEVLTNDNKRDFLTGIYNRRYFNLHIDQLWHQSREQHQISLLMMDIDFFKGYNDTYGHIKGDEVLQRVTTLITQLIRKEDVFSRYGGEEFALVLAKTSLADAQKIGDKIRQAVFNAHIQNESSPYDRITLSIGITSTVPKESVSVRSFIDSADKALYSAKENGRNRIEAL